MSLQHPAAPVVVVAFGSDTWQDSAAALTEALTLMLKLLLLMMTPPGGGCCGRGTFKRWWMRCHNNSNNTRAEATTMSCFLRQWQWRHVTDFLCCFRFRRLQVSSASAFRFYFPFFFFFVPRTDDLFNKIITEASCETFDILHLIWQ